MKAAPLISVTLSLSSLFLVVKIGPKTRCNLLSNWPKNLVQSLV